MPQFMHGVQDLHLKGYILLWTILGQFILSFVISKIPHYHSPHYQKQSSSQHYEAQHKRPAA